MIGLLLCSLLPSSSLQSNAPAHRLLRLLYLLLLRLLLRLLYPLLLRLLYRLLLPPHLS